MDSKKPAQIEILSGWKEIANYLGKGIRTVQRYEKELGLPIHRPTRTSAGSVLTTKAELDAWVSAIPIRKSTPPRQVECDTTALKLLSCNIEELKRLRLECEQVRAEVHRSLELLRMNLRLVLPETTPNLPLSRNSLSNAPERRLLADVLRFDPNRKKAN